jgi:hypothetical protein
MSTFVLTYLAPIGYTPGRPSGTSPWLTWFDGMGDAVTDLGKPVIDRDTLGNCDPASTVLGGYSVVTADDLDAALALAKGCPFLDLDGGVEVGLLGEAPPRA